MPIASSFLTDVGEPASDLQKTHLRSWLFRDVYGRFFADVRSFARMATAYMEHSIDANKRTGRFVPCLQSNDGD